MPRVTTSDLLTDLAEANARAARAEQRLAAALSSLRALEAVIGAALMDLPDFTQEPLPEHPEEGTT